MHRCEAFSIFGRLLWRNSRVDYHVTLAVRFLPLRDFKPRAEILQVAARMWSMVLQHLLLGLGRAGSIWEWHLRLIWAREAKSLESWGGLANRLRGDWFSHEIVFVCYRLFFGLASSLLSISEHAIGFVCLHTRWHNVILARHLNHDLRLFFLYLVKCFLVAHRSCRH